MKYFSREGYSNLTERVNTLETEFKTMQKGGKAAFDDGDKSSRVNANYEMHLEKLNVAQGRYSQALKLWSEAEIIDYPTDVSSIVLGTEVDLCVDGLDKTYQIVGYGDNDESNNRILYNSPIAKALMGKEPGDSFSQRIAYKNKEIEVIDIRPLN